jgi:hypothetical protein
MPNAAPGFRKFSFSYLQYDEREAQTKTSKLQGFGPMLFQKTEEGWDQLLGNHDLGGSIHSLIYTMRREKGAIPRGISFEPRTEPTPARRTRDGPDMYDGGVRV